MEERVNKLISQIQEKRDRLCLKAKRMIDVIEVGKPTQTSSVHSPRQSDASKYLYMAAAGLAVIGFVVSDIRTLSLTGSVLSAGVGYAMSKNNGQTASASSALDMSSMSTQMTTEVFAACKTLETEWDEFISVRNEEIKQLIGSTVVDDEMKANMMSKVYYYESLKISYPALNAIIASLTASNVSEIKNRLYDNIASAIKTVTEKQMEHFSSLTESKML